MTVVVLGNRLESSAIHDRLRGRVDVGIEALETTDSEYLVVSGGQTNPDVPHAECEVMRDYAVDRGLDEEQIRLNDRAVDTIGNGYFTRLIIEDLDAGTIVRVVSSCYHTQRAKFVFEQCYGPGYEIDADHCYQADVPEEKLNEVESLERTRHFFGPVTPGELDQIRERLIEADSYYDWLAK